MPEPQSDTVDLECQLLEAAKAGDLDTVRRIVLSNPMTVNCRDLDGRHSTPLHFAGKISDICYRYLISVSKEVICTVTS